jgi:hypothetical protein
MKNSRACITAGAVREGLAYFSEMMAQHSEGNSQVIEMQRLST